MIELSIPLELYFQLVKKSTKKQDITIIDEKDITNLRHFNELAGINNMENF